MSRRAGIAFLLTSQLIMAGSSGAGAEDHPPAVPTRDVDVLYDVPTQAGMARQRLRFSAATQSFRIDPPGRGLYVVIDQRQGRMYTVRDSDRSVIDMAAPRAWMPGINGGTLTRRGEDNVAGLPCTDWATTDSEHRAIVMCVTQDGVMLRAVTGTGESLIVARNVRFQPQNSLVFAIPESYSRLAPPPIPNAR
jgi:hypothetical protein